MNPTQTSFTYNGQTVNFTDAQKAILLADQNTIQQLQDSVRNKQNGISELNQIIAQASAAVSESPYGSCWHKNAFGKWIKDDNCYNSNNAIWNQSAQQRDALNADIDNINNVLIPQAIKKLNDDLATIQNDIKLQIQAQISNTNAANAPSIIANQNAQTIEQLHNQAALDKLKQEQNIKIAGFAFVFLAIVIGVFVAFK